MRVGQSPATHSPIEPHPIEPHVNAPAYCATASSGPRRRPAAGRMVVALLVCAAVHMTSYAQLPGGYAAAFLNRTLFAPEIARAGAYTPFEPDGSAVIANASALSRLRRPSLTFAASEAPLSQRSAALAFGTTVGDFGGLGIGVSHYGIGDVPRRTADGLRIGTTGDQWIAVIGGGALSLGPGSIGMSMRYIREDVAGVGVSRSGYAVDLSGSMNFEDRIFLATSVNNVAGDMSSGAGERGRIPLEVRLSGSWLFPFEERTTEVRPDPTGLARVVQLRPRTYLLAVAEARMLDVESDAVLSVAIEAVPVDFVQLGLRAGVNSAGDVSFGFLYRLPVGFTDELRIDYAARLDQEYGDTGGAITHHVSISAGF